MLFLYCTAASAQLRVSWGHSHREDGSDSDVNREMDVLMFSLNTAWLCYD